MKISEENLIKLDEFASSLGMKLYRIDYGFLNNNEEYIHSINGVNPPSEKYYEFINNMNQYKKCSENK